MTHQYKRYRRYYEAKRRSGWKSYLLFGPADVVNEAANYFKKLKGEVANKNNRGYSGIHEPR